MSVVKDIINLGNKLFAKIKYDFKFSHCRADFIIDRFKREQEEITAPNKNLYKKLK